MPESSQSATDASARSRCRTDAEANRRTEADENQDAAAAVRAQHDRTTSSLEPSTDGRRPVLVSVGPDSMIRHGRSPQPKEGQDEQNDDDQTHKINDATHGGSSPQMKSSKGNGQEVR